MSKYGAISRSCHLTDLMKALRAMAFALYPVGVRSCDAAMRLFLLKENFMVTISDQK